jgi:hypothetical protein
MDFSDAYSIQLKLKCNTPLVNRDIISLCSALFVSLNSHSILILSLLRSTTVFANNPYIHNPQIHTMYNKTLYLLSLLLAVVAARPTAESSLGDTIRDGCADPGPFQCALLIEAASDGQQEVGIIGGSCGSNILTGGDVASTSTGNNNNDPINYHGVLSTAYGPTLELWAQRVSFLKRDIIMARWLINMD